jgi:phage terminase large subunit GpA-like protein
LGETWEERGEIEDETILLDRREHYDAEVPNDALVLTLAVDTQDDRLEYEVIGWGRDEESWGIEKGIVWGKPDDPSTWTRMDDLLKKEWIRADGTGMTISCATVDSGGHFTEEVYRYCVERISSAVFPIRGMGGSGIPVIYKISRNNKYRLPLVLIGVDSAKTMIMQRLKIERPGPKYCHFPSNEDRGYDFNYFAGLISEKRVIRKQKGRTIVVWENIAKDKRNEPLDLRVYNLAALKLLNPDFRAIEERMKPNVRKTNATPQVANQQQKKRYGVVKRGLEV